RDRWGRSSISSWAGCGLGWGIAEPARLKNCVRMRDSYGSHQPVYGRVTLMTLLLRRKRQTTQPNIPAAKPFKVSQPLCVAGTRPGSWSKGIVPVFLFLLTVVAVLFFPPALPADDLVSSLSIAPSGDQSNGNSGNLPRFEHHEPGTSPAQAPL